MSMSRSPREGASPGPSTKFRSRFDITPKNEGPILRQYMRAMGSGFVTGASDEGPSGISTNSQAGPRFGLASPWTAVFTLPPMVAVQEICDRTVLVTAKGIGELAVKRFHQTGGLVVGVLLVVLTITNTLNIAVDLVTIGSEVSLLQAGCGP